MRLSAHVGEAVGREWLAAKLSLKVSGHWHSVSGRSRSKVLGKRQRSGREPALTAVRWKMSSYG